MLSVLCKKELEYFNFLLCLLLMGRSLGLIIFMYDRGAFSQDVKKIITFSICVVFICEVTLLRNSENK